MKGSPNESVTFQAASAKPGDENTMMSEPLLVNIHIDIILTFSNLRERERESLFDHRNTEDENVLSEHRSL